MWVPKSVIAWFNISQETVSSLRSESASLKAENTLLRQELQSAKINLDWLRVQFNQVQLERTALLEKTYNIKVPTPELVARPRHTPTPMEDFSYEDMGDKMAALVGLPTYDS